MSITNIHCSIVLKGPWKDIYGDRLGLLPDHVFMDTLTQSESHHSIKGWPKWHFKTSSLFSLHLNILYWSYEFYGQPSMGIDTKSGSIHIFHRKGTPQYIHRKEALESFCILFSKQDADIPTFFVSFYPLFRVFLPSHSNNTIHFWRINSLFEIYSAAHFWGVFSIMYHFLTFGECECESKSLTMLYIK